MKFDGAPAKRSVTFGASLSGGNLLNLNQYAATQGSMIAGDLLNQNATQGSIIEAVEKVLWSTPSRSRICVISKHFSCQRGTGKRKWCTTGGQPYVDGAANSVIAQTLAFR